jgi:type IX secretion system substrate protein/beta-propeller repeat-containing protein
MSKTVFTCLFIFMSAIVSWGQTYNWVKYNSIPIQVNPSIAVFPSVSDQSGNLVTGSILVFKLILNDCYGDVIIRKYNNAGMITASKTLTGKAVIKGVQTDDAGSIYVYGSFMDTLLIDPGNMLLNTGSGLNINWFMIKLNGSCNFVWKKNFTLAYGNDVNINTAKIKGGFIYTGLFFDTFNGALKKLDLNGNETAGFNVTPIRTFSSIDIDPQGNIFIAGSCQDGNIQFSNISANCPYVYSMYFAKFNSSFAGQWAKFVQDATFTSPYVTCDNTGNAYAGGDLNGAFVFDTVHTHGPSWVYDFFVAKINSGGSFLWVREVPDNPTGDAQIGVCNKIAVDNLNNVYMTGTTRGFINWGPFTTTGTNGDVLVLKYNPSGEIIWGKTAGGSGSDIGHSISTDNTGNILLSGNFQNSVQFDTIAINTASILNGFAAKLSNPPLGIINYNSNVPESFLLSAYPNPFNPVTVIKYGLHVPGLVNLKVYDILGNELEILINRYQAAGTYNYEWNAGKYSSGIYFVELDAGDFSKTIKLMLVK